MAFTTKFRLAAFATVIGVVGITFGFGAANTALDKKEGCERPGYISVAYGICSR